MSSELSSTSTMEPVPTSAKRSRSSTTKSGRPRKPHVMTEARKLAFEKCVAARKKQLSSKPEKTAKTSTPASTISSETVAAEPVAA